MKVDELKNVGEAPNWLSDIAYATLKEGYFQNKSETPRQLYNRVAHAAAQRLNKPEMEKKFFEYIDKNWLCLATPVAANLGSPRAGLPISCFSNFVDDTTSEIFKNYHEIAMLTKYGGGTGTYWGQIRGSGVPIGTDGATSGGVVPWLRIQDSVLSGISQGGVRRGSGANYLNIDHIDLEEFIDIRRPIGDLARKCLTNNFHHGVLISDSFMQEALDGNKNKQKIFDKILKVRAELGEPYMIFIDNANKNLGPAYTNNNLKIHTTNLCTEIFLHNSPEETFVCCLSSLNLARYDEWKDTDLIQTAIWFLDGVMEEFIQKAQYIEGFEKAVRFAQRWRSLGLGVLGWSTLCQLKQLNFDSFEAMQLNAEIFKKIKSEAEIASRNLAKEYGEPLYCKNTGMRNANLIAIAPTVSNSLISRASQGIEPIIANYYAHKTAKGTFIRKNEVLEKLLIDKNQNTEENWKTISNDSGSVKNLQCLSQDEKEVFKTAREINQFAIIRQAGQRQKWIDQGQSVNLFFALPNNIQDLKEKKKIGNYIRNVHIEAWKQGLKSLYYLRTESSVSGDQIYREASDCKACEG